MLVNGPQVRNAIETGALRPAFQPIVDLRTGVVTGFEVLARWEHPRRGPILPDNFIRLAEQNGLIDSLTEQIVRKAFAAAAVLAPEMRLAINLSPLQLRHRRLASRLGRICRETGMDPERLTLEITESAIIDNMRMASRVADDLKAMGCRLALDDFGTGYSSLIHLKALPFDELKVDRSFVREILMRRESRKIVSCVLEMGHALGLRTVAEGVETEEQCDLLYRLGCHSGQGWLYGKPVAGNCLGSVKVCGTHCDCQECPRLHQRAPLRRASWEMAAQLNAVYIGAPVGLCLLDTNMRYVSINRQLAEMNGYSEQEHIGRTPGELIPDTYPMLEPHLRAALRGARTCSFEVERIRNGENQTLSVSYAPVYDEGGEMLGVSAAVMDVTGRVRAERALKQRAEYYSTLVAVSPLMPWHADEQMNIVEVSPKWLQMTGLTEQKSLGMGWLQAIHPEDVAARSGEVMKAMQGRKPFEAQYRVRTRHGDWRWVRSQGWPRFAPGGELAGWSGYLLDVEEHRQECERMTHRLQTYSANDAAAARVH